MVLCYEIRIRDLDLAMCVCVSVCVCMGERCGVVYVMWGVGECCGDRIGVGACVPLCVSREGSKKSFLN